MPADNDYATLISEQLGTTIDHLERTLEVVARIGELVEKLERRIDELETSVARDLRLSKAARSGRLVP